MSFSVPLYLDKTLSGFDTFLSNVSVDEAAVQRVLDAEAAEARRKAEAESRSISLQIDAIFVEEQRRRGILSREPYKIPKDVMAAIKSKTHTPTRDEANELERRDLVRKIRAEERSASKPRVSALTREENARKRKAAKAEMLREKYHKRARESPVPKIETSAPGSGAPVAMPAALKKKIERLDKCRRVLDLYTTFREKHAADPLRKDNLKDGESSRKIVFMRTVVPAKKEIVPAFVQEAGFKFKWTSADKVDVMVVGDGPGYADCATGVPFSGEPGVKLNEIIKRIGNYTVLISNAMRIRCTGKTGRDRTPTTEEIGSHMWLLRKEIDILRPTVIITVGRIAHSLLLCDFDIKKTEGKLAENWSMEKVSGKPVEVSLRQGGKITVMPMLHPASAIRQGWELFTCNSKNENYYELMAKKVEETLKKTGRGWTIASYMLSSRPKEISDGDK